MPGKRFNDFLGLGKDVSVEEDVEVISVEEKEDYVSKEEYFNEFGFSSDEQMPSSPNFGNFMKPTSAETIEELNSSGAALLNKTKSGNSSNEIDFMSQMQKMYTSLSSGDDREEEEYYPQTPIQNAPGAEQDPSSESHPFRSAPSPSDDSKEPTQEKEGASVGRVPAETGIDESIDFTYVDFEEENTENPYPGIPEDEPETTYTVTEEDDVQVHEEPEETPEEEEPSLIFVETVTTDEREPEEDEKEYFSFGDKFTEDPIIPEHESSEEEEIILEYESPEEEEIILEQESPEEDETILEHETPEEDEIIFEHESPSEDEAEEEPSEDYPLEPLIEAKILKREEFFPEDYTPQEEFTGEDIFIDGRITEDEIISEEFHEEEVPVEEETYEENFHEEEVAPEEEKAEEQAEKLPEPETEEYWNYIDGLLDYFDDGRVHSPVNSEYTYEGSPDTISSFFGMSHDTEKDNTVSGKPEEKEHASVFDFPEDDSDDEGEEIKLVEYEDVKSGKSVKGRPVVWKVLLALIIAIAVVAVLYFATSSGAGSYLESGTPALIEASVSQANLNPVF